MDRVWLNIRCNFSSCVVRCVECVCCVVWVRACVVVRGRVGVASFVVCFALSLCVGVVQMCVRVRRGERGGSGGEGRHRGGGRGDAAARGRGGRGGERLWCSPDIAELGGWSGAVCACSWRCRAGSGSGSARSGSAGSQCARRGDVRARGCGCVCSVHARGGRLMHGRGRVRASVRVGAQPWCGIEVCVCVCGARVVCVSAPSTLLAPMCCAHHTY